MTASPPYPDSCNLKEAKTLLLKFIVDAETDGEMKDELPLLQKWLESQHADETLCFALGIRKCAKEAGLEVTESSFSDPAGAVDLTPFKELHATYLAPGAPHEVTIAQKNLKKFNAALESEGGAELSKVGGAYSDMVAQLSKELMPKFVAFRHETG